MHQFDPIYFTPPTGDTKRPRRLFKGSSGDGGAADRAAAETSRTAKAVQALNRLFGIATPGADGVSRESFVTKSTGKDGTVNSKLDEAGYNAAVTTAKDAVTKTAAGREQLYGKIGNDATNAALLDLNKERKTTERDLGFMLARAGLTGGSRDIDVNREILDTNQQGILKASNLGLSVANNARSSDDKTRVSLIDSIRTGLDQGSALQQSYEGMANNSRRAQDEANATSLVGFFDALKNQQQQAAYVAGQNGAVIAQPKKTAGVNTNYDGNINNYA